MNPLSLPGPAFLALWIVGALVVVVVTFLVHAAVAGRRASTREIEALAGGLCPTDIAHLAGGLARSVVAAVAGLVHRGALVVKDGRLHPGSDPAQLAADGVYRGTVDHAALSPVERFVLDEVHRDPGMRLSSLIALARPLDAQLTDRLVRCGLWFPRRLGARAWIYAPGALWLGFGLAKVCIGMVRHRPVGYLVLLLIVGAIALTQAKPPQRTRRGAQLLRHLTGSAHGLVATSNTAPQQLSGPDMALACAIFGASAAGATLALLMPSHAHMLDTAVAGAAGSCGSGCSSGCGSGCGGGCGGCS